MSRIVTFGLNVLTKAYPTNTVQITPDFTPPRFRIAGARRSRISVFAVIAGLVTLGIVPLTASAATLAITKTFKLFPTASTLSCLGVPGGEAPTANATVASGPNNDKLTLTLTHFKPGLAFDLFTVQRSNQLADGSVNPTPGFGLAWYQSDVHVDTRGNGSATIHTVLLNQIFGFDPDTTLTPTNTFNVGIWFNNPATAQPCGFSGTTPFNGEHNAGPVAFITRPDATTGLGPLCTTPDTATNPPTCKP